MKKYRIWIGEDPKYIAVKHLIEAAKIFRKHANEYSEGNSGLEINHEGEWDEWLDQDDQNIHEHIYMYGKEAGYVIEKDEEEEDKEFEFEEEDEDSGTGKKEEQSQAPADDEDHVMYDKFVNALAGDPSESAELDLDELSEFDEEEEEDFEEEENKK